MADKKDKAVETNKVGVTVEEVLQDKAEQSKKNIANGGKEEEISLIDLVKVEFIKDYGHMKKGQIETISPLAYEIYDKNKAVKKIS